MKDNDHQASAHTSQRSRMVLEYGFWLSLISWCFVFVYIILQELSYNSFSCSYTVTLHPLTVPGPFPD